VFEGIGDEVFNSEKAFIKSFINLMRKDLSFKNEHHKLNFDQRKIDNLDNPAIEKGELYGIFKNDGGSLKIHNRIYEQRIYNYLISKIENSLESDAFDFRVVQISQKKDLMW